MLLVPNTRAFDDFVSDHYGEATEDTRLIVEHDLLTPCIVCGALFTSEHDFDADEHERHGEWICHECSAEEHYDPFTKSWRY